MMWNKYPPLPTKLRWLMYIILVATILSLTLLLWTYRPDGTFQFSTHFLSKIPVQPTVPAQCGPGRVAPPSQKVSLVAVNGTRTLLVSAYQEHCTKTKEVRVIAVVLRSETVAYRCLICCEDQLHISEAVIKIHSNHYWFEYGTADIMCSLPSGCESPSHITVSSTADSEDNPDKELVMNKKAENGSFPYNFTVCITTMFDFDNVLQLVQSMETLQLLGMDRVVVYKTNCSHDIQRILDYYTDKGLMEVIPWSISKILNVSRSWLPSLSPGEIHYYGQIPVLNDCLYRYMYKSRYMVMHDIDELILPQSLKSWFELMPLLEEKYGADRCYRFQNNVFPNTVKLPPPNITLPCCSSWHNVSGVNILDHLYQEPIIPQTKNYNFKVIVNPRTVFTPDVHGLVEPPTSKACSWVDRDIARMYHTRNPRQPHLTPEELIYDGRLLSYSEHFIPRVNIVLTDCGLLPKDSME